MTVPFFNRAAGGQLGVLVIRRRTRGIFIQETFFENEFRPIQVDGNPTKKFEGLANPKLRTRLIRQSEQRILRELRDDPNLALIVESQSDKFIGIGLAQLALRRNARFAPEITSRNQVKVNGKRPQIEKERRIRNAGGNFVRDPQTGLLIDISNIDTRVIGVEPR